MQPQPIIKHLKNVKAKCCQSGINSRVRKEFTNSTEEHCFGSGEKKFSENLFVLVLQDLGNLCVVGKHGLELVKDIKARVSSSFTVSFFIKILYNGLIIIISELHKRKFLKPSKLLQVPFQECNLKCNSDWDVKLIICYHYLS